ncbi:hypothetical protein MCHI_001912, partial [Candidatus Magnetoovum chiemensis]
VIPMRASPNCLFASINYILLGESDHSSKEPVVIRGMVYKNSELDANKQFGLARIGITCCIADAVVFGIKVNCADKCTLFKPNQWVQVYGTIEKQQQSNKTSSQGQSFEETQTNLVPKKYILEPDKIAPIPEPSDPYIVQFQNREPFAY